MTETIMEETETRQTSLLWRILKWILLAVLLVILLFTLIGYWAWKAQDNYEATAVPYLEAVIPDIATWDPDVLWAHLDEEVKRTINRDEYDKVVEYFSTLGSLESLGHPEFRQVTSTATIGTGTSTFIVYQIPAEFENGDATINVTLTELEGGFRIAHFHVNSMAFVEHAIQEEADPSTADEADQ